MVAEDFRKVFGKRVRELRLSLKISQEQLAERSGLHRNYVGGVERGERNVALLNIVRLADALGVTLVDFFGPCDVARKRRSR